MFNTFGFLRNLTKFEQIWRSSNKSHEATQSHAHNASADKPRSSSDTGFEVATIQFVWDKYNGYRGSPWGTFGNQVPPRHRDKDKTGLYFYLVYVYMHKCPQLNWTESFRTGDGKHTVGRRAFIKNVFPIAEALANILDEVDWARRIHPYNHGLPPFDKCFTMMVDTLPI